MTTTTPVIGNFADVPLHGDRQVQPPAGVAVEQPVAAPWHTPEGIDV